MLPATVAIRECRKEDLREVGEICAGAGFGGQDIEASGVFSDRRLFALLFSDFYVRYERATSFVAVRADDPSSVVGYIFGSADTARYARRFARRMIPRIAWRIMSITLWRYPRVVLELIRWGYGMPWHEANPAGPEYPAHLHMNLLPHYRRIGIGSALLSRLECRLQEAGLTGVHLVTSNRHRSALPFYAKHGYRLVREARHRMWSGVPNYRSMVYAKKLSLTSG